MRARASRQALTPRAAVLRPRPCCAGLLPGRRDHGPPTAQAAAGLSHPRGRLVRRARGRRRRLARRRAGHQPRRRQEDGLGGAAGPDHRRRAARAHHADAGLRCTGVLGHRPRPAMDRSRPSHSDRPARRSRVRRCPDRRRSRRLPRILVPAPALRERWRGARPLPRAWVVGTGPRRRQPRDLRRRRSGRHDQATPGGGAPVPAAARSCTDRVDHTTARRHRTSPGGGQRAPA